MLLMTYLYLLDKWVCTFHEGDGKGSHWKSTTWWEKRVGKTSTKDDCARLVRNTQIEANGATWHKEEHICWAEFGQTRRSKSIWVSKHLENCEFIFYE